MVKVADPPPKPEAGALPIMSGAPDASPRLIILLMGAIALAAFVVGFVWGAFVGLAIR